MPTYSVTESFIRDFKKLSAEDRHRFRRAVANFVVDLKSGKFRKGLRVMGIQGAEGIYETIWAKDGRATFEYGTQVRPNEPHVIWRRCGTHAILRNA